MATELTLGVDDLARYTGETPDELQRWQERGLLGEPGSARVGFRDVARARLLRLVLRRGISLDAVVRLEHEIGMISRWVDEMYPTGDVPSIDLDDGARQAGLDPSFAERIWDAAGYATAHRLLSRDDVEFLRRVAVARDGGFPDEALLQMARVYADALGRVAEAEARLFHYYVHEPLRIRGLTGRQLVEATDEASASLLALVEPTVLYFHRRAATEARREDLVLHVAEETGHQQPSEVTGQLDATIAFVDLAGFTSLTEAMGDEPAVAVLDRFSDITRRAVSRTGGRLVKQIGDAFMLVFGDPAAAVACALDVNHASRTEGQFLPTRIGIHHGALIYREGDYLGATVNLAARITSQAIAHQILTTDHVATVAQGAGHTVRAVGDRRLRGIAADVALYELQPAAVDDPDLAVDPVCGMHLSAGDIAATLSVGGRAHVFCSSGCLELFVDAPARYADRPPDEIER